jgi:hypothetical protein
VLSKTIAALLVLALTGACGAQESEGEDAAADTDRFCELVSRGFVSAVQAGAPPLSAEHMGEAIEAAPNQDLRENLRRTVGSDGQAEDPADLDVFMDAFQEVTQLCSTFPPTEGYGIDFDVAQEASATSETSSVRNLEPIERSVSADDPAGAGEGEIRISFSGGVTCVIGSGPFNDEECAPSDGRAGVTVMQTTGDQILVLGPATTEATIAVRDATGTEVQVEMLTPHVWQADLVELQQPLAARIGDYQCFGIGFDPDFEIVCQHKVIGCARCLEGLSSRRRPSGTSGATPPGMYQTSSGRLHVARRACRSRPRPMLSSCQPFERPTR